MRTSPSPRVRRAFEAMGETISWPTPNHLHERSDTVQLRLVALTATLGLASASWVVAVRQMNGMDMGAATQLGSFASFIAFWVAMMAAMMLPGATPAVVRRTLDSGRLRTVPLFVVGYLAVWTLFGVGVFVLYHPHGALVAGALTIAAGIYELTPLKQQFRRRCREGACSAFEFGLCCVGSSIGLMVMLLGLGVMSVTWMAIIAAIVLVQKVYGARAAVDVPLALGIIAFGALIIVGLSQLPGLTPPM
jgi:predicted metal-binding membrane protein